MRAVPNLATVTTMRNPLTPVRLLVGAVAALTLLGALALPAAATPALEGAHQGPVGLSSGCVNNCPQSGTAPSDQGGAMLTGATIYLVAFSDSATGLSPGPSSFADGAFAPSAPNAESALGAITASPYGWWESDYSVAGQSLGAPTLGGVLTIDDPTLADATSLSVTQIGTELVSLYQTGGLPTPPHAAYVVMTRYGQSVSEGTAGVAGTNWCALHTSWLLGSGAVVPIAVIPDLTGVAGCSFATNASPTPFDEMTPALSHEVVEMVSDPSSPAAWISPTGVEVADYCEWNPPFVGAVSYQGYDYQLQNIYSPSAQGCYGAPVTPTIAASVSGTSSVTATLSAQGVGLSGQALTLSDGAATLATGVTGSGGSVVLSASASLPSSGLSVTFAGAGPLTPTQTSVGASTLTLGGPASALAGTAFDVTATLSPAASGVAVTLSGLGSDCVTPQASVATDATGVATFPITCANATSLTLGASAGTTVSSPLGVTVSPAYTLSLDPWTGSVGAGPVTVTAQVTPAVAGVTVTLSGPGVSASAVTGANGAADVALTLASGTYALTASATVSGQSLSASGSYTVVPTYSLAANSSGVGDGVDPVTVSVTLSPVASGVTVTLSGGPNNLTGVTNAGGTVDFAVTPGATTAYTATASIAGQSLSTSVMVVVQASGGGGSPSGGGGGGSPSGGGGSPSGGAPVTTPMPVTTPSPVATPPVVVVSIPTPRPARGLGADSALRSANHRFSVRLVRGSLELLGPGPRLRVLLRRTGATRLLVTTTGRIELLAGRRILWSSGASHGVGLIVTNGGRLELVTASGGVAWSL